MNPIGRVAIIGECMVELKKVNGQVEQGFGGDTLNTAIYLSRLTQSQGVTTSYVTGLGHDPFSTDMLNAWKSEGIDTDMVYLSDDKLPGIYAIETADDGERSFFYWRNDSAAKYWLRDMDPVKVAAELSNNGLVYLSGISLAILPDDCREKLIECLTLCRKDGVKIAFDNNYRPALWQNAEQAQHWYTKVLAITDMAFLTYEDEEMLWGDTAEAQSIERTTQFGVTEIVIKRGGDACIVIENGTRSKVAPTPVSNIVDTTAAGDSFSAGYLAKRILGGSGAQSAAAGHSVAGTVIKHRGAIIPSDAMPSI